MSRQFTRFEDEMVRIAEIAARLEELVQGPFGGTAEPARVEEVRRLTIELRGLLPNNALFLRLHSLVDHVETACSSRKWQQQGLDRVRDFAREDAYVIRTHAERKA
jgi:hypothetical protein